MKHVLVLYRQPIGSLPYAVSLYAEVIVCPKGVASCELPVVEEPISEANKNNPNFFADQFSRLVGLTITSEMLVSQRVGLAEDGDETKTLKIYSMELGDEYMDLYPTARQSGNNSSLPYRTMLRGLLMQDNLDCGSLGAILLGMMG